MELIEKTRQEILEYYLMYESLHKVYNKKGRFIVRPAIIDETILTIVSGKLETMKTVEEDSMVVRNIILGGSAETYVISEKVFSKRYKELETTYMIDGLLWREAVPSGAIKAFQYKGTYPISFEAPWGEPMLLENGDWLANPIGGEESDIYRIEKDTFNQTYL